MICDGCGKETPDSKIYILKSGKTLCWLCFQIKMQTQLDSEEKEKVIDAMKDIGKIYREGTNVKMIESVAFKEAIPMTDDWKAGIEFRGLTEEEADEFMALLLKWFETGIKSLRGMNNA